jgi:hypothetical protein
VVKLGSGYGVPTQYDVAATFARSKLSPAFGIPIDVINKKDLVGNKVTPLSAAKSAFTPLVFQDAKDGKYKIISFYAKRARGLMARYVVENRITDPADLKGFNVDGYKYFAAESTLEKPIFRRAERK